MKLAHHIITSIALIFALTVSASFGQQPELVVETGHQDGVNDVAFSPDGRLAASASRDQTIKLWEVSTGRELRTLVGHRDYVFSLAFTPDGKRLASGSRDQTIKLWNVETGELLRTFTGHTDMVRLIVISPDGKTLASASHFPDRGIRLWDVATGKEKGRIAVTEDEFTPVTWSRDSLSLISGDGKGTQAIKVWDAATRAERFKLKGRTFTLSPDGKTVAVVDGKQVALFDLQTGKQRIAFDNLAAEEGEPSFSPDGKTIACVGAEHSVLLFEIASGKQKLKLEGHNGDVFFLAFSPDGKTLATSGREQLLFWDAEKGAKLYERENSYLPGIIAFSPDGQTLAIWQYSDVFTAWDVRSGRKRFDSGKHTSKAVCLAFSPDGRTLAKTRDDGTIRLWNLTEGKELRTFTGHTETVRALAFSPDGNMLASGSADNTVKLWDVQTGKLIRTLKMPEDVHTIKTVGAIAFSPDGKNIAEGGSWDGALRLWNVATGALVRSFKGHTNRVNAIAFSTDGKILASASSDKTIKLWDAATGNELRSLAGSYETLSINFSLDNQTLAGNKSEAGLIFATGEQTVQVKTSVNDVFLWDVATGAEKPPLKGHTLRINSVVYSPDNRLLASAGDDRLIKLWDTAKGAELRTLKGHTDGVNVVAFSPDGRLLASGSNDTSIRLWDTATGKELASLLDIDAHDWLVITPEGFFDGSPAAWKKILWRFNQNTFNATPVEAFFNEFFYPNLLADVVGGKQPAAKQSIANLNRQQPRLSLTLVQIQQAQTITVGETKQSEDSTATEEAENSSSDEAAQEDDSDAIEEQSEEEKQEAAERAKRALKTRKVTLRIEVSDASADKRAASNAASGARDVRLFRNGSLIKAWRGDVLENQQRRTLEVSVPIIAGENNFTAYAFNSDNVKSEDAQLIIDGGSNLKRQGTAYIITVGVNEYANREFNLRYAVPDAQIFGEEISRQQQALKRFAHIEVVPLLDREATKANILLALQRLAGTDAEIFPDSAPEVLKKLDIAQPEDLVMVYFSGHGLAVSQRFYLIPTDIGYAGARTKDGITGGLQTILAHSISDRELEEVFEKVDAGQLVLVIDACNSGQALEAEEKRRGPMNSKGLAQLAYEKGISILTAAESQQVAVAPKKLGHGYLTYALISEGLKGERADAAPHDGRVYLREWLDYATERVPQMQDEGEREQRILEQEETKKNGAQAARPNKNETQRPRVFYRRETETRPLIIAGAQ